MSENGGNGWIFSCPPGISDILNKETMFAWAGRPVRGRCASPRLHAIVVFRACLHLIEQKVTIDSYTSPPTTAVKTLSGPSGQISALLIWSVLLFSAQTGVPQEAAAQARG